MKKRLVGVFLLLAFFCSGTGVFAASAGSATDPLISESYIAQTYIPRLKALLSAKFASFSAGASAAPVTPGLRVQTVSSGGNLSLGAGQSVVLLSGSASLSIQSGSVVNASVGFDAADGLLNRAQRYIVCGSSAATVTIRENAAVSVSSGAVVTQGSGKYFPFTDVAESSWYHGDVVSAYDRGLVNGVTTDSYQPGGSLTVAQAVKLAACMHQLYHDGAVQLQNSPSGTAWYRSYVDYALENEILAVEFADYDAVITRRQFVKVFYSALPDEAYAPINTIADNAIPDVTMQDTVAAEIYTFYRAGILTGYAADSGHAQGAFGEGTITRAEVAVIMNRMFDDSARRSFSLGS